LALSSISIGKEKNSKYIIMRSCVKLGKWPLQRRISWRDF